MRRALLALLLLAIAPTAWAQPWPDRPVRLIVPSSAGDAGDLVARLFGQRLGERLGQPFVVENRPGAGGRVGVETAVRAPADGSAFLLGNAGSNAINAALYADLPFDLERDLAPVSLLVSAPNVLVVNPRVPARTLPELIAWIRAQPRGVDYASGGNGSSAHLNMEMLRARLGDLPTTHIPYRGSSPALTDLVAGNPPVMFVNLPPAAALIERGQLRLLAVTTAERWPALPEVPTVAETVPGFESTAWFGLLAPASTPRSILARLHATLTAIAAEPAVQDRVRQIGGAVAAGTPEQFASVIRADIAKWREVVRVSGARPD
jgi:tripartite-type tricarboxylate transporter receptor subunit TctC